MPNDMTSTIESAVQENNDVRASSKADITGEGSNTAKVRVVGGKQEVFKRALSNKVDFNPIRVEQVQMYIDRLPDGNVKRDLSLKHNNIKVQLKQIETAVNSYKSDYTRSNAEKLYLMHDKTKKQREEVNTNLLNLVSTAREGIRTASQEMWTSNLPELDNTKSALMPTMISLLNDESVSLDSLMSTEEQGHLVLEALKKYPNMVNNKYIDTAKDLQALQAQMNKKYTPEAYELANALSTVTKDASILQGTILDNLESILPSDVIKLLSSTRV